MKTAEMRDEFMRGVRTPPNDETSRLCGENGWVPVFPHGIEAALLEH